MLRRKEYRICSRNEHFRKEGERKREVWTEKRKAAQRVKRGGWGDGHYVELGGEERGEV